MQRRKVKKKVNVFQGPPRFRQWWGHWFGEWVDIIRGGMVSKAARLEESDWRLKENEIF